MVFLLLALSACDRLDAATGVVDDLGDTTVAQAIYLGADLPPGVTLPEDSGIYTSLCKVFLAEVADASDVSDAPVSGAKVSFLAGNTGKLPFAEDDDGEYLLYSTDGLEYTPGQDAVVRFEVAGEAGELHIKAPEAPSFTVSDGLRAHEPAQITVTEGRFPNLVAMVYDLDHDVQSWDNVPDDVETSAELNPADSEPITTLAIPGEAFLRASTYVIGVAGLNTAAAEDMTGVNGAMSAFAAGQLAIQVVSVDAAVGP